MRRISQGKRRSPRRRLPALASRGAAKRAALPDRDRRNSPMAAANPKRQRRPAARPAAANRLAPPPYRAVNSRRRAAAVRGGEAAQQLSPRRSRRARLVRPTKAGKASAMANTSHRLDAGPETVHWGYFDAKLPAVLRIDSGDTVTIST